MILNNASLCFKGITSTLDLLYVKIYFDKTLFVNFDSETIKLFYKKKFSYNFKL